MVTLIESLRDILGSPQFYLNDGSIDYGAATEYIICGVVLCIVVSSVFKLILLLAKG